MFDILGYDRVAVTSDPNVIFIAYNWRYLDGETRNQIIEHIREENYTSEPEGLEFVITAFWHLNRGLRYKILFTIWRETLRLNFPDFSLSIE